MPRRGRSFLPSFISSEKFEGQRSKSLPEVCLKRLRRVVELVRLLEVGTAKEIHVFVEREAQSTDRRGKKGRYLLTSTEMQQYEDYYTSVTQDSIGGIPINTETDIRTYLSQTKRIQAWLLVARVLSRLQTRYIVLDGIVETERECRNVAQVFLDLGVSIIRCLDPIKFHLQELADEVLIGMRMRLEVIHAFAAIFQYQNEYDKKQNPAQPHSFVILQANFNVDDPLPTNVAEAYPVADSSLRAILIGMTLFVVIGCIVPVVMAVQRSPTEMRSKDGPEFWVALQTMFMQLLGLITMMLPVYRFTPIVAWQLAWTFAILAGCCTIAVPILHDTCPPEWSILVSFIGSVAQATVVLQVMLKSNFSRVKTV